MRAAVPRRTRSGCFLDVEAWRSRSFPINRSASMASAAERLYRHAERTSYSSFERTREKEGEEERKKERETNLLYSIKKIRHENIKKQKLEKQYEENKKKR